MASIGEKMRNQHQNKDQAGEAMKPSGGVRDEEGGNGEADSPSSLKSALKSKPDNNAKADRLAAALRQNLHRRKAQARGRKEA
jgi:hypothetical protein